MDFLRILEGMRTPLLDRFFQFITYFGQEIIVVTVICALFWCVDKRLAYQLGFTYFTAGLCVQTLKITFRIPRPWVLDPSFHPVKSAVPGATGYSFPSGHTQGATSLFAPLALKTRSTMLKTLCIFAFLLIGFSRMYLGCHTPQDVLTSIGISLFFSWLIWHIQESVLDVPRYRPYVVLFMAVISIAVCIYAFSLLTKGVIDKHYAIDCCKAAGAGLGFASGWYIERKWLNFPVKTATIWGQLLKLIPGLIILALLKTGLKSLLGPAAVSETIRYFILVLWILVIYPYCFSKLQKGAD